MSFLRISRRRFLGQVGAAAGAVLTPTFSERAWAAPKRQATDPVALGRSGVKICRLGIGTGSNGGAVQRKLGQDGFTRLLRYAYDQGITYIDTADAYATHTMIREAIKGLPREKLFIQTKMKWGGEQREKPLAALDRFRKELGTEYVDSLLIHCATRNSWHEELKPMMDAFAEAQSKQWIRVKGVSCHGLPGLTRSTQVDWVDVHLVRINPQARHVDGAKGDWAEPGDLPAVVKEMRAMHDKGHGIIGMKIIGNGEFTGAEDREKSIRYAMTCGFVDAVVIGFASPGEIDEATRRMNSALA